MISPSVEVAHLKSAPLYNVLVALVIDNAADGCVIVTDAVVVQLLTSVTVTVYVPAARLDAPAVVVTGVVFHEYVYGAVPPAGVTVAAPVLFP